MNTKLMTLAALVLAFSPSLALAHPIQNPTAHFRAATFHDRSPKTHERNSVAHR